MILDGDIIILDPCSAVSSNDDWQKCGWGEHMDALGFSRFLYMDAGSDGNGTIVDTDSGEVIGTYCTDSCVYVVLLFDELMKYNPGYSDHIRYPDTCVIIRGFHGEITFDENSRIIGTGNVNFRTK